MAEDLDLPTAMSRASKVRMKATFGRRPSSLAPHLRLGVYEHSRLCDQRLARGLHIRLLSAA